MVAPAARRRCEAVRDDVCESADCLSAAKRYCKIIARNELSIINAVSNRCQARAVIRLDCSEVIKPSSPSPSLCRQTSNLGTGTHLDYLCVYQDMAVC